MQNSLEQRTNNVQTVDSAVSQILEDIAEVVRVDVDTFGRWWKFRSVRESQGVRAPTREA